MTSPCSTCTGCECRDTSDESACSSYTPDDRFPSLDRDLAKLRAKGADASAVGTLTVTVSLMVIGDNWKPTPAAINKLPKPIRDYIHDLASNCDPSGMVRENTMLKDLVKMLEATIIERRLANLAITADAHAELKAMENPPDPNGHWLYRDGDSYIPPELLDTNGQVVLSRCKLCGRAECELDELCTGRKYK